MVRVIAWVGILSGLIAIGTAVADEPPKPPVAVDPDHAAKMVRGLELFRTDVRALLTERCLKCHSGDDPQGKLDLSTRDGLLKGGERGPAVITGRGEKSLLSKLVSRQQEPFMPEEGDALSKSQLAVLAKWIDLGAPYDQPLGSRDRSGPSWTERKIDPEARRFWSFRPLARSVVPTVHDADWCRTPIDCFIRAAQEHMLARQ